MKTPSINIGYQNGAFEVIQFVERQEFWKKMMNVWACHCHQCGRIENVKQTDLVRYKYDKCTICRRPKCSQCKQENVSGIYRYQCSEPCYLENKRIKKNTNNRKRYKENPEIFKNRYRKKMAKLKKNPKAYEEFYQKKREQENKLLIEKPETARKRKATWNKYYQKNKKALSEKGKEYRADLTKDQIKAKKKYMSEYFKENKEDIYNQQEKHFNVMTGEQRENHYQKKRATNLKYRRKKQTEKQLNSLFKTSNELLQKENES